MLIFLLYNNMLYLREYNILRIAGLISSNILNRIGIVIM